MFNDLWENPLHPEIFQFLWQKAMGVTATEFLGGLLVVLLGFCLQLPWKKELRPLEKLTLIFPMGMAGIGIILFVLLTVLPNFFHFKGVVATSIMVCATLIGMHWTKNGPVVNKKDFIPDWGNIKASIQALNSIQVIAFLVSGYVLFVMFNKTIFWPIVDWDAITTFDFYGRTIALEGEMVNSIVREKAVGTGVAYPPLTHLIIAFSYLAGFEEPKWIFALNFISLTGVFYAFSRRFINRTGVSILLLMFVITPEMTAFASFCKTNLVQTNYALAGTLVLLVAFQTRNVKLMYCSTFLLAFNAWVRSEGIEFIGIGALLIAWAAWKGHWKWKHLGGYMGIGLLPFLIWQLYLGSHPDLAHYQQVSIEKSLFWDGDKYTLIATHFSGHLRSLQLFGITFWAVLPFLVINVIFYKKAKNHLVFIGLILAILLHFFLLYQLHYKTNNMEWLLNYSLKRYVFNYVPLAYLFIGTSFGFQWVCNKLDSVLAFSKPLPKTSA